MNAVSIQGELITRLLFFSNECGFLIANLNFRALVCAKGPFEGLLHYSVEFVT